MIWTILLGLVTASFILALIFVFSFIVFLRKEEYLSMVKNCEGCENLNYCPDGTPYCTKGMELNCSRKRERRY